jgi:D-3-phosphoglycerate dehydrogenase / 2-oxoglutarate reductase
VTGEKKMRIFVSTFPFGAYNQLPFSLLDQAGANTLVNPLGRKLAERELAEFVKDCDILIAGTEPVTEYVMDRAPNLRCIVRVGIGLDSVSLNSARRRGIAVSYTPDAPSAAVSELTIGMMISVLRSIHLSNQDLHHGNWVRHFGRRLGESVIGVIGVGRIGTRVINHLQGFECKRILANDILPVGEEQGAGPVEWVDKQTIYSNCDIISLHLPLTPLTRNMITDDEMATMKSTAVLINTSRGGIVDESALFNALENRRLGGAGIDTFEVEPYQGPLTTSNRCLLTAHMGSMSEDCRARMEIEATQEAIRFLRMEDLQHLVPECEFENQA